MENLYQIPIDHRPDLHYTMYICNNLLLTSVYFTLSSSWKRNRQDNSFTYELYIKNKVLALDLEIPLYFQNRHCVRSMIDTGVVKRAEFRLSLCATILLLQVLIIDNNKDILLNTLLTIPS